MWLGTKDKDPTVLGGQGVPAGLRCTSHSPSKSATQNSALRRGWGPGATTQLGHIPDTVALLPLRRGRDGPGEGGTLGSSKGVLIPGLLYCLCKKIATIIVNCSLTASRASFSLPDPQFSHQ